MKKTLIAAAALVVASFVAVGTAGANGDWNCPSNGNNPCPTTTTTEEPTTTTTTEPEVTTTVTEPETSLIPPISIERDTPPVEVVTPRFTG